MKWFLAVAVAAVLLAGCGSDDGPDPYRNAVSDKRAPEVTVTVRDDDGEQVADIAYDASNGRIAIRATYAFLQTLDEDTWSTAYTLSDNHGIIEGVPDAFDDDAHGGPGPDTYPLPDLDADNAYRICVSFVVGHPELTLPAAPLLSTAPNHAERGSRVGKKSATQLTTSTHGPQRSTPDPRRSGAQGTG